MPAIKIAPTREILRKRVRRLLRLNDTPSAITVEIIPYLKNLGSVALIGGAIRDVARAGRRGFQSDLDFVIYGSQRGTFLSAMNKSAAVRNKFGGYALQFPGWKVDVWHIEDTWAKTAGHVNVRSPSDLLFCTFFDWDSVLYDISQDEIIASGDYLMRMRLGIMNIRLEPNPNPIGSVVRALRRAALWNVKFGSELTKFSLEVIENERWVELVKVDENAFHDAVLKYIDIDKLKRNLNSPIHNYGSFVTHPIPGWHRQLELFGPEETSISPKF